MSEYSRTDMYFSDVYKKKYKTGWKFFKSKRKVLAKYSNSHHMHHQSFYIQNDYNKKLTMIGLSIIIIISLFNVDKNREHFT